ncbi:MAG: transporter substrate-binding domain-containing protein, partial [Lachnospiraceae bacterium]|nr:transporter substrate-binding domain-containing protein [Lachnospiraceae bacterium]
MMDHGKQLRNKTISTGICILLAVLCMAVLTGCAIGGQKDASLSKVLESGQLVLGLDADFPPMGFTDENGKIVGFDIDMASEVCSRLGISLVTKPIDWDKKESELDDGHIDCIWNGLSVTPQRSEIMNLSKPYMQNEMIFAVMGGSQIRTMKDLEGKHIGVQSGSTAQEALIASDLHTDETMVPLQDNVTLLQKLEEGSVDAVFLDSIVAYYFIAANDKEFYVIPSNLE